MGRAGKRRRGKRGGPPRRPRPGIAEPRDPLDDVFESGGDLFLAVGYTPGGAPFGPRVEIVDGELRRNRGRIGWYPSNRISGSPTIADVDPPFDKSILACHVDDP